MIAHDTPSERLHVSLPDHIIHIANIYDLRKMCLKKLFFFFYFLNTHISVPDYCAAWKF